MGCHHQLASSSKQIATMTQHFTLVIRDETIICGEQMQNGISITKIRLYLAKCKKDRVPQPYKSITRI